MARIAAVDVVLVGEVGNISAADGVGAVDDDSSASVVGGGIGSGI